MMVGSLGTTLTLESKSPFDLRLDQSRAVPESAVKKALRTGDIGFLHSFTTGSTGSVGTDSRPLQLDNFGTNNAANIDPNLTASAGTGGVFAMVWDSAGSAGPGTVYDVARGLASELPVGSGASETCLAPGITAATTTDTSTPAVGASFWYLVRVRSNCGTGSYGVASNGTPRVTSACP